MPHVETPSIFAAEGRTDLANGRRFAHQHGGAARWCDPWGTWLAWDGRRWEIDTRRRAEALAQSVADGIWDEIGEILSTLPAGERKALLQFADATADAKGISNMLAMVRSQMAIVPDDLDRDPMLLNVENGTIDLRTGQMKAHDKTDYITKLAPVVYSPCAECSRWLAFLDEIMAGDAELIDFLQRLCGYWLTGVIKEHVLPICYGGGANGKSVFLGTIQKLLGHEYSTKAAPDLLMAKGNNSHPTERADLFGRRLVIASETEAGRKLAEAFVKELTGDERIKGRFCKQDFFEFAPTFKLCLATNHKPRVNGTDHGMWRRLRLVPFNVTFAADQQDKELPAKLQAELPGILNWALAGAALWQANGLTEPEAVLAATESYKGESDTIAKFVADCCVVEQAAIVGATELWDAFKKWCEANAERLPKRNELADWLTQHEFAEDRYTSGTNKGKAIRRGIGLAADQFE